MQHATKEREREVLCLRWVRADANLTRLAATSSPKTFDFEFLQRGIGIM